MSAISQVYEVLGTFRIIEFDLYDVAFNLLHGRLGVVASLL